MKDFFTIYQDKSGFWIEYTYNQNLITEGPFLTHHDALKTGENHGLEYLEEK